MLGTAIAVAALPGTLAAAAAPDGILFRHARLFNGAGASTGTGASLVAGDPVRNLRIIMKDGGIRRKGFFR